jgi:hypothetical protein
VAAHASAVALVSELLPRAASSTMADVTAHALALSDLVRGASS